ncbi:O-antigen/teichoic acid export membrane protein [Sphingomonas sp. PP-CE-1A-559]|nr:O-antigen/teichoic acid export membrane protein [Sphingomonas sp. PP-CE-1A-559]
MAFNGSSVRRIVLNVGANGYAQVVLLVSNFVAVPFYILNWGMATYGSWLSLTATIMTLFAMADAGIGPVSGNALVGAVAEGDDRKALRVLQTFWLTSTLAGIILVAAGALVLPFVPLARMLSLSGEHAQSVTVAAVALLAVVALSFQIGIAQAAMRAIGGYASGSAVQSSMSLVELAAICTTLSLGGGFLGVTAAMGICRLVCLVILIILRRRASADFSYGFRHAHLGTLRALMGDAGWFMVFPICNAAAMYATVPILNLIAGPVFVASFAIARTLARTLQQAVGVFSGATWPEITVQYIKKNMAALRTLFVAGGQFAVTVSVFAGVALFSISSWLFEIWLQGRHAPPPLLVGLLIIESALAASKSFSDTILMATNHHLTYAKVYLAAHVGFIGLGLFAGRSLGWVGFEIPLILLMATLLVTSSILAGRVVGLTYPAARHALFDIKPMLAYVTRLRDRVR